MMKKIMIPLSAFGILMFGCKDWSLRPFANTGTPFLQCTSAKAASPAELRLYFSEEISSDNSDTSLFRLRNASTGDILPLGSISAGNQAITLSIQSPHVMTAGHIYDVAYQAVSRMNKAAATGTYRFLADFSPPDAPSLAVHQDSSGNLLLLWTPNNRIGNTSMEVWRKSVLEDSLLLAILEPNRSAYWARVQNLWEEAYALRMANDFGKSSLGSWVKPRFAAARTFSCIGVCLKTLIWNPAGYALDSAATTCDRVEYVDPATKIRIVRTITDLGVKETTSDSAGTVVSDSLVNVCN